MEAAAGCWNGCILLTRIKEKWIWAKDRHDHEWSLWCRWRKKLWRSSSQALWKRDNRPRGSQVSLFVITGLVVKRRSIVEYGVSSIESIWAWTRVDGFGHFYHSVRSIVLTTTVSSSCSFPNTLCAVKSKNGSDGDRILKEFVPLTVSSRTLDLAPRPSLLDPTLSISFLASSLPLSSDKVLWWDAVSFEHREFQLANFYMSWMRVKNPPDILVQFLQCEG